MNNSYKNPEIGAGHLGFINSEDGKIQQETLWQSLSPHLPQNRQAKILDAGCGSGWLLKKLSEKYSNLSGCDISEELLNEAKRTNSGMRIIQADLDNSFPFTEEKLDAVILNMVSHDLKNQQSAFNRISRSLSPEGVLLITTLNPYYAYPAGSWKKSNIGKLLGLKPRLLLQPYNSLLKKNRQFNWYKKIPGYFYSLPEQINNALAAGFALTKFEEISSQSDSRRFDLRYRLFRYPILLLLVFKKL